MFLEKGSSEPGPGGQSGSLLFPQPGLDTAELLGNKASGGGNV